MFSIQNKYFPSADGSSYQTSDGRLYSPADQLHILNVVRGAWYLMIVCGQAAHIWVCRTDTLSIFEHGLFRNMFTNVGVLVALLLGCFVTYCPGLQEVVQSANPFSLDILYASLFTAFALWAWAEGRKWVSRTYPSHWINRTLKW